MRRKYSFMAVLVVVWLFSATVLTIRPVLAWDSVGHEQIADIAWTRLTPATKTKIKQILLSGDPQFRPAHNTEAEMREAFRKAATFPDFIKQHHHTSYANEVRAFNKKFEPNIEADISDTERDSCKTFHFFDTPIRAENMTPPAVRESNALKAMALARSELARLSSNNQDRRMQAWWLYWITHVTGDLHQPLHCAESFHKLNGQVISGGDAGGNKTTVSDPGGSSLNLHSYWDDGIERAKKAGSEGLSTFVTAVTTRWTLDSLLQPSQMQVSDLVVKDWIDEGAGLAKESVYKDIPTSGKLDDNYKKASLFLCKKQAVLGGYRLAALLNEVLGQ